MRRYLFAIFIMLIFSFSKSDAGSLISKIPRELVKINPDKIEKVNSEIVKIDYGSSGDITVLKPFNLTDFKKFNDNFETSIGFVTFYDTEKIKSLSLNCLKRANLGFAGCPGTPSRYGHWEEDLAEGHLRMDKIVGLEEIAVEISNLDVYEIKMKRAEILEKILEVYMEYKREYDQLVKAGPYTFENDKPYEINDGGSWEQYDLDNGTYKFRPFWPNHWGGSYVKMFNSKYEVKLRPIGNGEYGGANSFNKHKLKFKGKYYGKRLPDVIEVRLSPDEEKALFKNKKEGEKLFVKTRYTVTPIDSLIPPKFQVNNFIKFFFHGTVKSLWPRKEITLTDGPLLSLCFDHVDDRPLY